MAWIGVDLDGTLAHYDGDWNPNKIGAPIPRMVDHVKRWIADGKTVKIFSARAGDADQRKMIGDWTAEHIGKRLEATNVKDYTCEAIYDDRAHHVVTNTGEIT